MNLYDKEKVDKETAQSRAMFFRELPKMFGYLLFFYAILGIGIPWRMGATRDVILNSVKASLIFGSTSGGIMLIAGAVIMSIYTLRKALYADFCPAASLTMVWSFRLFGVVGVPLAFWDVFRVILPATGSIGEKFIQDWWMWLLLVGGIAGWFAGRSVGGLIALLAIWLSGRKILKQL